MLTKIVVVQNLNQDLKKELMQLKEQHKDKLEGIYDLYSQLYINAECRSYSLDRIYYVAYTLASRNIKFLIEGSDTNG